MAGAWGLTVERGRRSGAWLELLTLAQCRRRDRRIKLPSAHMSEVAHLVERAYDEAPASPQFSAKAV